MQYKIITLLLVMNSLHILSLSLLTKVYSIGIHDTQKNDFRPVQYECWILKKFFILIESILKNENLKLLVEQTKVKLLCEWTLFC